MTFIFSDLLSRVISRPIYVAANVIFSFFFYGKIVFRGIRVPHLLCPFRCEWAFRLLP